MNSVLLTYKSEVHGTDNSQQVKLIVSEISDLKDNLDVVNEHIAVAKDQRRCPGCNAVFLKILYSATSAVSRLTILIRILNFDFLLMGDYFCLN